MIKLTIKERKWIVKVQKALDEQPTERIAFYTIGDNSIVAYDHNMYEKITGCQDSGNHDFGPAVLKVGADINGSLWFKHPVESTAG
jgi:hypothetical protein